jgi:uncharacterized protein (DUF952 family)
VIGDPARRAEAVRIVDGWPHAKTPQVMQDRTFRASVYAHLGETEKAFALLAETFAGRGDLIFGYINSPWFAPLRSDPRWQSIVVAAQGRR